MESSSLCRMGKEKPQKKRDLWQRKLETLPSDFFSSSEALLMNIDKSCRGLPAYKGLSITEKNNEDMEYMYDMSFRTKIQMGQPRGAYDQFKSTVGQFARMCISLNLRDRCKLYRKGHLFETVVELKAAQLSIKHFQVRSCSGTVCGKSRQLRRLALFAEMYFSGRSELLKGKASQVGEYLRNEAACHKSQARKQSRHRKSMSERMERLVMLLPEDFSKFLDISEGHLDSIMQAVYRWKKSMNLDELKR